MGVCDLIRLNFISFAVMSDMKNNKWEAAPLFEMNTSHQRIKIILFTHTKPSRFPVRGK